MSVVNNKSHGHEELKEIQNMLLEYETTPSNIWETDVTGPSYVLDSLRQKRLKVIYAQERRGGGGRAKETLPYLSRNPVFSFDCVTFKSFPKIKET